MDDDQIWELLGTPFGIGCTSDAVGAAVARLFQAFPGVDRPVDAAFRYLVVDGCEPHGNERCLHTATGALDASGPVRDALSLLLTAVNRAAIDAFAGFAVHAGVVAAGESAIAFPAPSGTGKTTLAAAGLRAGFDYVSDEALCVGPAAGQLVSYPRALALSPWSRQAVGLGHVDGIELDGETAVPVDVFGARVAAAPLKLAHVVNLVRSPGSGPGACELAPSTRGEAMTWLIERSFNHYKRPAESFHVAAALARGAHAWRLAYSDPLEAAALLWDRLG